jgi:hypothetical protein
MLRAMASVLWLDFDSAALAKPLTQQFVAEFAAPDAEEQRSPEERVIAAVEACSLADEEMLDFVARRAEPASGLVELWDWAHWNGWQMAVGGVTFDLLMDPVLDGLGLDRVARHCGRTDMLYRRRVRFLSPRGIEIRSNFLTAFLGSYRAAGDFVVYVGNDPRGSHDAELGHVALAGTNLADAITGHPGESRLWNGLTDVLTLLEKEADGWRAYFSSTTAAED